MKVPKKIKKSRRQSYRSKFEKETALSLRRGGVDFSYETLKIPYFREQTYTPDFIIGDIIIEAKGYFKSVDRTKHKLVRSQNPGLDIRFLFMNAYVKLSKRSKTTYAQWCDQNGFLWCHRRIPDEWIHPL